MHSMQGDRSEAAEFLRHNPGAQLDQHPKIEVVATGAMGKGERFVFNGLVWEVVSYTKLPCRVTLKPVGVAGVGG